MSKASKAKFRKLVKETVARESWEKEFMELIYSYNRGDDGFNNDDKMLAIESVMLKKLKLFIRKQIKEAFYKGYINRKADEKLKKQIEH